MNQKRQLIVCLREGSGLLLIRTTSIPHMIMDRLLSESKLRVAIGGYLYRFNSANLQDVSQNDITK
jgi:hypothetical protein